MKKRFYGLRYKLLGMIMVLVTFPIIVITVIGYLINARLLLEQVHYLNENAVNKTATALEFTLDSIRNDSLELYQQEIFDYLTVNVDEMESTARRAFAYLCSQLSYDLYIEELHLQRLDGHALRTTSIFEDLKEEQKILADHNNGRLTFVGKAVSHLFQKEESYIFARLIKDSNNFTDLGYMQIIVPQRVFNELLQVDDDSQADNLLVNDNVVMISTNPKYVGKTLEEIFGEKDTILKSKGSFTIRMESGDIDVLYSQVDQFGWGLVNCVKSMNLQAGTQRFNLGIMLGLLAIVLFVVSIILARMFSRAFLRPLLLVAKSMEDLEAENYNLVIPEQGNDEITVLAHSFNQMSRHIYRLLNDVYLLQIKEKEAQIRALQAYINPHFLYNTLDTICWMSRMEGAPETGRLVEALSGLLRMSINADMAIIEVEKEIQYTRHYLMIQECRYADSIEFVFEIEAGLENYRTVNFILQPLIENAIIHGLEPKEEYGHIYICIYREGEELIYSVKNDGVYVEAQELNQLISNYESGQRGLAIAGVNKRIKLNWGEQWGLYFENTKDGQLVAVVSQPLIKEDICDAEINDCG